MSKRKKLTIIILSIVCFFVVAISVSAAIIASLSVRGEITTTSTTISAAATYTSEASDYKLEFSAPGDEKHIDTSVINNTTTDSLHVYHEISLTGSDSDLADAILVYYNGKFVNTLSSIITNHTQINDEYALIAPGKTVNGRISFELHNSAPNGLFDGKTFGITITTYAENMDYGKYILVTNEAEFNNAIDDINSGYFDELPTIVLQNAITLSNAVTIKNPTKIHLNSYALTGSITVNDDNTTNPDALLEVLGTGSITSATVGANYNVAGAKALVKNYIESQVKDGISATDTINILGPYGFYGLNIVTDNVTTYTAPNLTGNVHYTTESKITIGSTEYAYVKALGTDLALVSNYLNHLPQANEIISSNLFLPTAIPGQNATIEWKSSNTSIMSDKGKIVANGRVDASDGDVELIATIKVNDTTYTERYAFRVSSHSNEVNFQKLVQDMSPLIITLVDGGTENTKYYLPKVGTYDFGTGHFSQYDYRTTFTTPSVDPTVTWNAHQNIDLTSITYSMTPAQAAEYDYITIDSTTNNKVYLSKNTLSNYAKITVTGRFSNGEEYSSILNISIALGSDTQLLEKAFSSIDQTIGNISILGNMLKTRSTAGIIGEKGDFILPSKFGTDYTISYTCDSDIISSIEPVIEDGETTGYKFIVDPIKFKSTETSVPIYVTVTYLRPEGNITKQKAIYIDAPAAIHTKDVGTISIFNTLKYQTFQALGETTNNGFTTSTPLVTDNGYDYLLIRDMIGDANYLTDYRVSDLYLTMNGITSGNYASGVSSLKLYVNSTNNTSTTDTAAYDFVRLLEWATGNTKVTAGSVVSTDGNTTLGTLANNKSNGETYLTNNELSVIEAYYRAKTNDDGTKWNALKSIAMETAPGRIYDNADLLVTVLKCLTDEKTTNSGWYENNGNGPYGKIYAKYLEIVNRYAITTSSNEEPMSPAQEVYNSKFYYSFTPTAQNSTSGTATTEVSFPCRYYDATGVLVNGYCNRYGETNWQGLSSGNRQGTYAAASKKGIPGVDLYANETGYPYDSDKTKYITSAELMVIKAFWLGALGAKTARADTNVLAEFNTTSTTAIAQALAPDDLGIYPYPNYSISDFRYYGQALLNAFDACLVIPTYFTSNGISLLVESFYNNYNTTGYHYREYGTNVASPFTSVLVNTVPAVTNLDNLEGGLAYFKKLTSLDIKGNTTVSSFLSDYGLSQAFARVSLTNPLITTLTMQYVSAAWNTFDVTNIKNLRNLLSIDLSNNLGLKTVNPLLNINRFNYTSVNFANIGEVYEYNAFVIDNLASSTCAVTFTNEGNATQTKTSGNPSLLVNLSDIGDFVSEHLYLTNVIYNDDGTQTDVCWRVEQGNEMNGSEINQGGELVTLDNIRDMNMRISPYYYCEQNTSYFGYNFKQYGLYKIVIDESDHVTVTPINFDSTNTNMLFMINPVNGVPSTNYDSISDDDPNLEVYPEHLKFSGEYSRTQTTTATSDTIYSQDSSIVSNEVYYTILFRYYYFWFGASDYDSTSPNTYYLRANGQEFRATQDADGLDCYFSFLTQNEADFVVELRNNNFHNTTDVIMEKYGITAQNNQIILGTTLPGNATTISNYYMYSISTQQFVTVYGFSSEPISKFNITCSSKKLNNTGSNQVVYEFLNKDNNKYLGQTKISTSSDTESIRIGIGIIYHYPTGRTLHDNVKDNGNNNFCVSTGSYSHFRDWWLSSTVDTYNMGTVNCAENTPTLDITAGKDMTATAHFNCCYIGNGSDSNSYVYRMYDTGAFLLISNDSSVYGENAKFCFLTQEEKDRLEEWYENPQEDITIGSAPVNHQYYYIYCPYTRRFIAGGTTDRKGEMYTTVSDFDDAQIYFIHKSKINSFGYYIIAGNLITPQYLQKDDSNNSSDNGISGFNAFGGVTKAYYIALWKDDANTTCAFSIIDTPFEISYEVKATSATYIAYQVDYTVAKVRAHILERDIWKEYKFDNFYYLKEDLTIDGITYKAGNVIRFVVDAYYGTQYEADIEYYELILTYYDDKDKTDNSTHKHTINQFNLATYIYYYYDNYSNIQAFSNGKILYQKLPTGVFEKYNASFTYNTHLNTNPSPIQFPETKWIYTSVSFDQVKSDYYLDAEGAQSAANSTYVEGTNYYKPKYVVATVFAETFDQIKSTLYTDTNGTRVAANATFNPAATYYVVGYTALNPTVLTTMVNESYTGIAGIVAVEIPIFEYYKYGIYTDTNGTRVALNATYNSNTTYYFLQPDGTYSTATPKVYSSIASDYVSLTLNATTFEYFKHHIYLNNTGTEVNVDAQYNSDVTYYTDNYVASTFKNDVLNTYRSVLYKDEKGKNLDSEETFNPNIIYYTNEFVVASIPNQASFNTWKSRLYANQYGLPLAANATYDSGATYYKRTFVVAQPEPTGNTVEGWVTTKNAIIRLYSHTKLTTIDNFVTYVSDYSKVYTNEHYPIVYRYIGNGSENIYADPTITVSYEAIRTGSVTAENFSTMRPSLYEADGTPIANDAVFEQGKVYYIRTWTTVANIKYPNVSYIYNYGYYLIRLADDSLQWQEDEDGVNSNTAETMDTIIAEANSHFHDLHYNEWYGKHYAYNGFTMASTNEILDVNGNIVHGYDKGNVYRIVVNSDNTGFIWKKVYPYFRKEGDAMVTEASTGVAHVGDTIYAVTQCFGGFYRENQFYRIISDDFTKTLNVVKFTDVVVSNTVKGYTDLQGQKIRYIHQSDYLGYAGTYELIISAVVREDNGDGTYNYTDSVRTYKIKFVGTVIM